MVEIRAPLDTPRPVIFDVDGTLVDSNDAHAHAWVDALKEAGYEVVARPDFLEEQTFLVFAPL